MNSYYDFVQNFSDFSRNPFFSCSKFTILNTKKVFWRIRNINYLLNRVFCRICLPVFHLSRKYSNFAISKYMFFLQNLWGNFFDCLFLRNYFFNFFRLAKQCSSFQENSKFFVDVRTNECQFIIFRATWPFFCKRGFAERVCSYTLKTCSNRGQNRPRK